MPIGRTGRGRVVEPSLKHTTGRKCGQPDFSEGSGHVRRGADRVTDGAAARLVHGEKPSAGAIVPHAMPR